MVALWGWRKFGNRTQSMPNKRRRKKSGWEIHGAAACLDVSTLMLCIYNHIEDNLCAYMAVSEYALRIECYHIAVMIVSFYCIDVGLAEENVRAGG